MRKSYAAVTYLCTLGHFALLAQSFDRHSCGETIKWLTRSAKPDRTISLHRNGDPHACGVATISANSLAKTLSDRGPCLEFSKYTLESVVTEYFVRHMKDAATACQPVENEPTKVPTAGLVRFCDMGPIRTVDQADTDYLVRLKSTNSLPCRWMTREGLRITKVAQLWEDELEDLFAVPAGRVFQFAPLNIGETFALRHTKPYMQLEVLSVRPTIFEVRNFISQDEVSTLLAAADFDGQSKIGLGGTMKYRTSESSFVTNRTIVAPLLQK